jgi:hypothetical protein
VIGRSGELEESVYRYIGTSKAKALPLIPLMTLIENLVIGRSGDRVIWKNRDIWTWVHRYIGKLRAKS